MDLTGQRFGKLTVVSDGGYKPVGHNRRMVQWICRCDCGKETTVLAMNLRGGITKSCGCGRRDANLKRCLRHGHARGRHRGERPSREFLVWMNIKDRCYRSSAEAYPWYGGRGIVMCERWRNSFEHFLSDMGLCPANSQIDRIDNDGNYAPDNCRWITHKENCRNKRGNVPIEFNGICFSTIAEAAERYGITADTVKRRLKRGVPLDAPKRNVRRAS